jgi:hypothetical protein
MYCSSKNIVGVRTDFGSKTQQKASCNNIYDHESIGNLDSKPKTSWDKLFS